MTKFSIEKIKPVTIKKGNKFFKSRAADFFLDQQKVVGALSEALLEGDREAFHEIISGLLSVINKEELARRSKVPIATIRRMAAGENFNIDSMLRVTSAISKEIAA